MAEAGSGGSGDTTRAGPASSQPQPVLENRRDYVRELNEAVAKGGAERDTRWERGSAEAIERRWELYVSAHLDAKRPALQAISQERGDADERVARLSSELRKRDPELVTLETQRRWAEVDAQDFRKLKDPYRQEAAAGNMADTARGNPTYRTTLANQAPDVYERITAAQTRYDANRPTITPVVWRGGSAEKLQDGTGNVPLYLSETPAAVATKATTNERRNLDTSGFAVVDARGLASDHTGANSFSISMAPAIEQASRDNKPGVTFHNVLTSHDGQANTPQTVHVVLDNRRFLEPFPVFLDVERDKPEASREKDTTLPDLGIRLESLGKGRSSADVDETTSQVVIRRSGRIVERLDDDKAIADFAERKRLSNVDRETLARLAEVRHAEPAARAEVKLTLGPDAKNRESEVLNVIAPDLEKVRLRTEVNRNDAEIYAWVEKQKKARQLRAEPAEPAPIGAAARPEAKGDDTPGKVSTADKPVIPPEIEARYLRIGNKFYHPKNTEQVAFEDKGSRLETRSNSQQIADTLVTIARSRGWENIKVSGTETFRKEVWLEAAANGMHTRGYTPSELDKAELAKRVQTVEANRVEPAAAPRDSRQRESASASDTEAHLRARAFAEKSVADAVRVHPELAGSVAITSAMEKKAAADGLSPAQRAIVAARVRENLVNSIERGDLPEAKVRDRLETTRETTRDRDHSR